MYLGLRTFWERTDRPEDDAGGASSGGLVGAYSSTFLLTVTNPTTIFSFVAIFAALGLAGEAGYAAAAVLVLGVFTGSSLWWLFLTGGVSLLSRRVGLGVLRWANRASGTIILGFGVAALLSLRYGT